MRNLELVVTVIPTSVKKEVTETQNAVAAGTAVKMEIGESELDATVPAGKVWDVVANIRIVERDA